MPDCCWMSHRRCAGGDSDPLAVDTTWVITEGAGRMFSVVWFGRRAHYAAAGCVHGERACVYGLPVLRDAPAESLAEPT